VMSGVFKMQIHLTPVDPELYPYIEILPPDTKIGEEALKNSDKTINTVNEIFDQCIKKSEEHREKLFSFNPTDLSGMRPQVKYATRKMEKIQRKIVSFSENYFIKMAGKISRLAHFLMECKVNNCPADVYPDELRQYIRTSHDEDSTNVRCRKRLSILDNYANRLSRAPMVPHIPNEQIIAVAKELSGTVDPVTLYSVPSFLDDFIFYYISAHNLEESFEALVKEVSVNPKFINMRQFQPFVNKFVAKFGVLEKNEKMVIRVAVSRFFFEMFFKSNSKLYIEQPDIDKFLSNCSRMSDMSPKVLLIDKKFVRDCDFEKPFKTIVEENHELQTALENLIIATFYSYPVDILQCVYSSMKCTEEYVKKAYLERECGGIDKIDWESETARMASSDLAFDDFFPIFSAVFSVGPMANALAIQHLLDMIEKLVIPTTFDFAKVVYMTTVSHISSFDFSQYLNE
jgi:hypothetical protein